MEQQFKCVIFDVDGTLLDTSRGIITSVRHTIDKFQLEQLDDAIIKTFIGPPIQNSFRRIYGFDDEKIAQMTDAFRERYKNEDLLLAEPYEGIFDVLEQLLANGIIVAIATYKRKDYARSIMEHFGFDKFTNIICGSDFEGRLKKKDIIRQAMEEAGIDDLSGVVMVGDSDNDADGARENNVKFIGVTYGFGFKTKEEVQNIGAIGVAGTARELKDIILGGTYEN